MKIIGLQTDIVWEDKSANFSAVRKMLEAAKPSAGSLVVLPELFATGFSMDVGRVADRDGAIEKFLSETAKTFGVYLLGGVGTKGENKLGRNEALVVDPQGNSLGRYCKIHPFSYAGEHNYYESGREVVTFAWSGFTVAPFVCYDLRFPEIFRTAVRRGVNLFVVIANWPKARVHHWRTLLLARAIENQAYVVGLNRAGRDPKLTYAGASMIVDPRGQIVAEAGEEPAVIEAELDLNYLNSYRCEFPALNDMR